MIYMYNTFLFGQSQEESHMTLLFFLLLVKHAIADLCLQGYIKGQGKSYYFDKKLWLHSLHHGIGTALVVCPWVPNFEVACAFGLLDMIFHWQIDYSKTWCVKKLNVDINSRGFWWIQGVDQALHYATYFLIVFLTGWVGLLGWIAI